MPILRSTSCIKLLKYVSIMLFLNYGAREYLHATRFIFMPRLIRSQVFLSALYDEKPFPHIEKTGEKP